VILARQLAGYLALPVVIIDPSYIVVYYNEPAERMLGRRFDEVGVILWADWSKTFAFTDHSGRPMAARDLPMGTALERRHPAHASFRLRGLDGVERHVEEVAIPLIGLEGQFLGALGLFAEIQP
jgi:PAS domain-containing protein